MTSALKRHPYLLSLAAVVFSILLVEIGLRLFYRPFNPEQMEDQFANFSYAPPVNALGFRQARLPEGLSGRVRILLLGDSFTFGHGIADGRNRFGDIIERRLNAVTPGGPHFHVYNAATEGSNPGVWLESLRTLLPVYNPQSVIAVFFLRDGTGLGTSFVFFKSVFQLFTSQVAGRLWYRASSIGKWIGDLGVKRRFSEYYIRLMKAPYVGRRSQRQFWLMQQRYLLAIRDACRRNGADFRLVIFPMLFGLESGYQFRDVEDEIARFAREAGIPVFSLTPSFLGKRSRSLWISPNDQHPNELGNRIAADALYPYLKRIFLGGR